jgi:2-polyprenyl-3-methyl-5-hydroxy-6-metoxy-1,4-benzoquinol methylase
VQVRVEVGDVCAVPAAEGEFDAVVSVQVLEHVADVGAGVVRSETNAHQAAVAVRRITLVVLVLGALPPLLSRSHS